jgi:hypothetical protein
MASTKYKKKPTSGNGRVNKPNPGDDYRFNLGAGAIDRYDVVMVKWTITNPSLLHADLRQQDRASDKDVDVRHQLDAIRSNFEDAMTKTSVGRVRAGRVDTGEELIRANNTAVAGNVIDDLAEAGFVMVDAHYYMRPGKPPHGKDKYTIVCVFARQNAAGSAKAVELSGELMEWLWSVAETTFQNLHVWGNPDGTMTWNFGGRSPDQAAKKTVRIVDGQMGLYAD